MRTKTLALSLSFSLLACEGSGTTARDLCADADPYGDLECLTALSEECQALTSEDDCWAAPRFSASWVKVGCAWTRVTEVSDADSCELGRSFGRCEGAYYLDIWGPKPDGCQDDGTPNPDGMFVFVEARELVDLSSPSDGDVLHGIAGPWIVESSAGTPDAPVTTCVEGQASPEICACSVQACAAMAGL